MQHRRRECTGDPSADSNSPAISRIRPKAICRLPKSLQDSRRHGPAAACSCGRSGSIWSPAAWLLAVGEVVPLSTTVDQLMDCNRFRSRTDASASPAWPRGAAAAALLLLPQPGRFPALAEVALARRARRLSCCSCWRSRADAARVRRASNSSSSPSIEASASAKNRSRAAEEVPRRGDAHKVGRKQACRICRSPRPSRARLTER